MEGQSATNVGNRRPEGDRFIQQIFTVSTGCQALWWALGRQLWTKDTEIPARVERTFQSGHGL